MCTEYYEMILIKNTQDNICNTALTVSLLSHVSDGIYPRQIYGLIAKFHLCANTVYAQMYHVLKLRSSSTILSDLDFSTFYIYVNKICAMTFSTEA